jgi:hypothetical protein
MENDQKPKKHIAPVIWGAVLITVGVIWMLCAAHIIRLSFEGLFKYIVPFSMIVCGIILLVKNKTYKIICLAASIVLFILFLIFNSNYEKRSSNLEQDDLSHSDRREWRKHQYFDTRAKFDVELKNDVVKVEATAGAAKLKAGGITENYLDVYRNGELRKSFTAAGEKEIHANRGRHKSVELEMAFNATSMYDMQFEFGAISSELDLTPYKVRNIEVEMGASDLNLTIGDKVEDVAVKIESGAGSITVRVPISSRCSVLASESFLVGKSLPDFKKIDGMYKTDNFESAKNTVAIVFEGAVSDLKIERY